MATAEAAAGPRYAPDDPTLPKPWKGLIDGSTGVLYYWNPETNVTQYERPANLPSPLANSQQQFSSMPNLAQNPVAQDKLVVQPAEQTTQVAQQQGQQFGHLNPQLEKMTTHQGLQGGQATSNPPGAQEHVTHSGPAMQQPSQSGTYNMHYMGHQTSQMLPQIPQQRNEQFSQQTGQPLQQQFQQPHHGAGHQLPPHQNPQMPPLQGQPFAYQQQMQYMVHQQSMYTQGHYNFQQQTQHALQGQQHPYEREKQAAVADGDKVGVAPKNKTGISPSHCQQSVPNQPAGAFFGELQQYNGSTINMQRPASMVQMQQPGPDFVHHQHGPGFQNHTVPSSVCNQQSDLPPPGMKISYDNSTHGRASNGSFANPTMEGPMLGPSQPKIAPVHVERKHQELRLDGVQYQNFSPGYAGPFNSTGHNMHANAIGGSPFPNNAFVRPPFASHSDVSGLSAVELYCQENEVTATGDNVPAPFTTFEATNFPPEILRDIHSAGFSSPTPIQAQTWPIALQSRDIVAIAKTGSGKTLGYLIPAFILIRQQRNNRQNGPMVLVLAPTRELATQIQEEVVKFGRSSRISCTCLYGGVPKVQQLRELDRGADIVVATPGRLNDILEMRKIHLGHISLLVLDEADRMLDMGFEPQIRKIVNEIPPRRQTLMYTATWPKGVRKIASDLLVNPVQVNIGSVDELEANKSIKQNVEVVPSMEKERRLEQILRSQERGSKVIIFCSTKRLCDQLARSIGRNFGALAIHGDKSQGERDWVLNQFRSGKSPILVATDVAARGLDIKDIRVVINYDFPTGIEDYVHRIGRTGRAGATGVSYTFFSEQDWKHATDLVKVLEGANQFVPPEVREIASRGASIGKDRGGNTRFDSGIAGGGDRWGFEDRSRGEMRSGGFIGRGGMRDGGFGGRGGSRDGGFGGRGGARDVGFGGRGGRNDSFSGRGNRGGGFGGPGGWARNGRGPMDRYNYSDSRGRGRGRGRGRFDGRRDAVNRSRDRSYSRSPERVRTWRYSRSRSRSRSWSRSRSRSWSGSRSRSRSYSYSPHRSRSRSRSRSRRQRGSPGSHSHGHEISEREGERNFDDKEAAAQDFKASESGTSPASGIAHVDALPEKEPASSVSPMNQEAAEESGY